MINRLLDPTSGTILIDGKDIQEENPQQLRRRIGYVIQNIGLFPHYTVADNVAVVPKLLSWDKVRIRKRTEEILEMVGLSPDSFLHSYPDQLSGGQQQRVGLARALAADPALVLLDEPFGALDPITRTQIQKEFKKLESMLDKTMILVTHDVLEAVHLGDRICLMDQGTIQQIGTAKELLFNPENDFVTNFFQANRLMLEMKMLTPRDILGEINPRELKEEEPGKTYQDNDSLLDIVQLAEESPSKKSVVTIIRDKDERITTTVGELMSAFFRFRSGS
jgi:osmoprotectant transport system ATP-binding protein